MNFRIIVVSWELVVILNKVSPVVGEIWHAFTWLNQFKTFWVNNLVNIYSIKECCIESLFLRYIHSLSALKPNLKSSFLVTIFLWINLNWNSFNLVSPQMFFGFGWKWKWEQEYCQTSYTKTQNSGTELPKRVKPLNKCSKLHPTTQPV